MSTANDLPQHRSPPTINTQYPDAIGQQPAANSPFYGGTNVLTDVLTNVPHKSEILWGTGKGEVV